MQHRVLLVDDHPGFRRVARLMMESGGLDVVAEADTCRQAMVEFTRVRPDAVLLDLLLPDGDGLALAEQFRRSEPSVAVVLTSSRTREELGNRLAVSAVRGFLHKSELTAAGFAALVD